MDDDYELVPKDLISQIKKENNELKKKISQLEKQKPKTQTIKQDTKIIEQIKEEGKKEQETIIKHLESINQVSESTLNNVLDRTQKLDGKMSEMSKNISLFASSITELVEVINDNEKPKKNTETENKEIQELKTKIDNLEEFMKKLELLLSQVKKIE